MTSPHEPALPSFDAGHEVAGLIEDMIRDTRRRRRAYDGHTNLLAALDDLDGWLDDPRPYDPRHHQRPWRTLADDVGAVFATRGAGAAQLTPSITELGQQLAVPNLGADPRRRQHCRGLVAAAGTELGRPETRTAALDDLVAAARKRTSPADALANLGDVLQASIASSGRGVSAPLHRLESVLDDNRWDIEDALQELDATPEEPTKEDVGADAGLNLSQRLDLARRLLLQIEPVGRQVVWLVYDHAKLRRPTVVVGPVTFFDGPRLVDALAKGTELYHQVDRGDRSWKVDPTPLPDELPKPGGQPQRRWHDWPPKLETWVAVRVDLGEEQLPDPVRTAIQQAESLVRLAGFHLSGTPWQRLDGHKYLRDGVLRGQTLWWTVLGKRYRRDDTDLLIEDLQRPIGPHLPVKNAHLQDLLDAAAVLDKHHDDLDPTSIVHSIRVVEKLAGLVGTSWQKFLTNNYSIEWARDSINDTIIEAITGVQSRPQLLERAPVRSMPSDIDLYCHDGGGLQLNLPVAVAALPAIAKELPFHHPAARLVRDVAARTASTSTLTNWVAHERKTFDRLVHRLARCRDALAHGGPLSEDTARTIQVLAWTLAKRATSVALYSVVKGDSAEQDQQQQRQDHERWLTGIPKLSAAVDAFS